VSLQVVPTSNNEVLYAANLPLKDFEDALQCAAALTCDADVIVTRNVSSTLNIKAGYKIMICINYLVIMT